MHIGQLEKFQAVRDELRGLLLEYFEFESLLAPGAREDLDRPALENNFEELKKRLKAFWVFHDHLGAFIPDLVDEAPSEFAPDLRTGWERQRQARRDAMQYLLTLLPESRPRAYLRLEDAPPKQLLKPAPAVRRIRR